MKLGRARSAGTLRDLCSELSEAVTAADIVHIEQHRRGTSGIGNLMVEGVIAGSENSDVAQAKQWRRSDRRVIARLVVKF